MPRESYQEALATLQADVVAMGDLVVERLDAALECYAEGDVELATDLVESDAAVNDRYLDLETQCVDLIALQQPVAGDLRFVVASFKILTDLERIADLAADLAGYAATADRSLAPEGIVEEIGRAAMLMVEDSLAAYADADAERCYDVAGRDDDIDASSQRASETIARDLVEREAAGDDPWAVERLLDGVTRALLTLRDLERIADHAVNIAARTLYMVENDPALIY